MNKEKEDICYGGLKGYGKTYCEMIRLQQENKELHNKIDKAIEYIEKECCDLLVGYFHNRFDTTEYYEKLLEILKDSDVDEK